MLLVIGPDRLFYRGPPVDGARHRHHALQLAMALGAPLMLKIEDGVQQAEGFVIAADTPHQLTGGAPEIALLYLEPESSAAIDLKVQTTRSFEPDELLRHAAQQARSLADFDGLCTRWLGALGVPAGNTAVALDARIADTLAHLATSPDTPHSAAALAARVQLSPDRLMHLFAAATGTSLRSYVLWLKLKTALHEALAGASLTEAAHAAGFVDSAHLSHSFKAMFGLPPRFLFQRRDDLVVLFR